MERHELRLLEARIRRQWGRLVKWIGIGVVPLPLGLILFQFEPFTNDPMSIVAALLVFAGVFSPAVVLLCARDRWREIKMARSAGESPLLLRFQSMEEVEEGDALELRVGDEWDIVYPPGFLFRVNDKVRPLFVPVEVRAVGSSTDVSEDGYRSLSDEEIAELNSHVKRYANLWRWEWLLISWGLLGVASLILGWSDSSATRLIAVIVIISSLWASLTLLFRKSFSRNLESSMGYCLVQVTEHPEIEGLVTESLKPEDIPWTYNGEPAQWRLSE